MANERKQVLDESNFIRQKMHGGGQSLWRRYAGLILARPTLLRLLRYELVTLLGPIPGVIGLVLRRLCYPCLFASTGKGVVFGRGLTLRHADRIHLGEKVVLDDYCVLDGRGAEDGIVLGPRVIVNRGALVQAKVGHIHVGADTSVGAYALVIAQGDIDIAEAVSIASGAVIAGGRFVVEKADDADADKRRFTSGAIRIARNCRIGINAVIQDGVSVGEGAIVTPASVVVNDVAAYAIVSGNPARPWRSREGSDDVGKGNPSGTQSAAAAGPPGEPVFQCIQAHLEETYFAEFGAGGLGVDDSLFENGIIDSISLLNLVLWLQNKFGIDISSDELLPANFETLEKIVAFVSRKRSAA